MNHSPSDTAGAPAPAASSADPLLKAYVEPTNRCNLNCVTCIRHSWDESPEDLDWTVYGRLIEGLAAFPEARTVAFAGFGEPLLHPRFPEMIRLAHESGLRTEITTNAMLLTPATAERLVYAGLDQITVSVDGTSNKSHGAVRPGASLDRIVRNVRTLYLWSLVKQTTPPDAGADLKRKTLARLEELAGAPSPPLEATDFLYPMEDMLDTLPQAPVRIGIEFVAMKSNIHELPDLQEIARKVRASFILVSNVLPYAPELQDEILYERTPTSHESQGDPRNPLWILPRMDWSRKNLEAVSAVAWGPANLSYLDINLGQRNNYCPFIGPGSVALSCHGGISPCPPLLHSYTCYIRDWKKSFRRCEYGSLKERSLESIWRQPDYASFRERVRKFEFSPCIDCCGCEFAEGNETDCHGNPFPVCGHCLWARGVLRCA
jgi:MoaA/NifB/PqqE/SkfB family radical SAM enzyme